MCILHTSHRRALFTIATLFLLGFQCYNILCWLKAVARFPGATAETSFDRYSDKQKSLYTAYTVAPWHCGGKAGWGTSSSGHFQPQSLCTGALLYCSSLKSLVAGNLRALGPITATSVGQGSNTHVGELGLFPIPHSNPGHRKISETSGRHPNWCRWKPWNADIFQLRQKLVTLRCSFIHPQTTLSMFAQPNAAVTQ